MKYLILLSRRIIGLGNFVVIYYALYIEEWIYLKEDIGTMSYSASPSRFALRPRTVSTTSQISQSSTGGGEEEEEKVVYLGDDKPVQVNRNKNNSISKDSKG